MRERPPGAPRPKAKHVGLLDYAIDILSAVGWAPRGGPQRRILLGARGFGGGEEGRGRGPLLQHRAAQAEVHHVRVTAVVHHDESDVKKGHKPSPVRWTELAALVIERAEGRHHCRHGGLRACGVAAA